MKWIVFWTVINSFVTACPPNDIYDDYGRLISNNRLDLVACWDSSEERHCKYFESKKLAEDFVNSADNNTINGYKLKNFSIVEDKYSKHGLSAYSCY